jgi:PEP-CTERM motif
MGQRCRKSKFSSFLKAGIGLSTFNIGSFSSVSTTKVWTVDLDLFGTNTSPDQVPMFVGAGNLNAILGILTGNPANTNRVESVWSLTGSITFDYTPVTLRSAPVPEPSTWAMMLLGFGGLGFLGYLQTRRAKPQAA